MKLLITSDNHLGFQEMDPIRKNDSFDTFDEILKIATKEKADAVLQGGDLFHYNKPSRHTYNRILQILKAHCLQGARSRNTSSSGTYPYINILSNDIMVNTHNSNLSISLPILSIHGNHDDPSGFNSVSPIDILHSAGLVNYFGKVHNVDDIEIYPVLMEKDGVFVALYGLGHIKDRRLYQTFLKKKVKFIKPSEMILQKKKEDYDGKNRVTMVGESFNKSILGHYSSVDSDYYYICMVHQNRVPREMEYLPEDFLPSFFHLVIYGHEHESIKFKHRNFHVIQVGSSVRTSISQGETGDKYAYILELINKNKHKQQEIDQVDSTNEEYAISLKNSLETISDVEYSLKLNADQECDKSNSNNKKIPFVDMESIRRIKLKTVRPCVLGTIKIKEVDNVERIIEEKVEDIICKELGIVNIRENSNTSLGCIDKLDLKPLLRIKIDLINCKKVNKFAINSKIGQICANPNDWLRINRKNHFTTTVEDPVIKLKKSNISDIYLQILKGINLKVVPDQKMIDSLNEFVEKDNKTIFTEMIYQNMERITKYICKRELILEDLENMIRLVKNDIDNLSISGNRCFIKSIDVKNNEEISNIRIDEPDSPLIYNSSKDLMKHDNKKKLKIDPENSLKNNKKVANNEIAEDISQYANESDISDFSSINYS